MREVGASPLSIGSGAVVHHASHGKVDARVRTTRTWPGSDSHAGPKTPPVLNVVRQGGMATDIGTVLLF